MPLGQTEPRREQKGDHGPVGTGPTEGCFVVKGSAGRAESGGGAHEDANLAGLLVETELTWREEATQAGEELTAVQDGAKVGLGNVGDDEGRGCFGKFFAMLALKRGRRADVIGRLTFVGASKDCCRFAMKVAFDENGCIVAAVETGRLDAGDEEGAPLDGGDVEGRQERFSGERGSRRAGVARESRK